MTNFLTFPDEYLDLPESRKKALIVGSQYYFTGKKCNRGHLSPRYTSSSNCVRCIEERIGRTIDPSKRKVSDENKKRADDAKAKGFTTYVPENPCKHGHMERYVNTGNCVICAENSRNKRKELSRWSRIKKLYGLTKNDFFELLRDQNSTCAICGTAINRDNAHVDHCHNNGQVRGLLCSKCNQAIGLLQDSEVIIKKAAEYVVNRNAEGLPKKIN